VLASVSHMRMLAGNSELLAATGLNNDEYVVCEFLTSLIESNRLSLREVETLILYLEIYQILTSNKGLTNVILGYGLLRIFGVFLYCFKPGVAENIVRGEFEVQDIAKVLGKSNLFRQWGDRYPDVADVVTAMVSAESGDTDKEFSLSEEELQHWKITFRQFFQGGVGRRSKFLEIVVDAIETLKLAG